jgi:dTDP-3-amino-3,4,6-trideoxy-alpha-D-glucose transaminase
MAQASARTLPFVDLSHVNAAVADDVLADIRRLLLGGSFTNGADVALFEHEFAEYCGAAAAVGVGSGLDALRLALVAAGTGPGDEVVVPAQTFVATFEAVIQAGATPVVADISEADWNLDPAAAAAACGPRTRCVLPVHLFGQMADMRAVRAVAARVDADVVEDACQAHGAVRDGVRPGGSARAAAFSFYPTKNLGAFGDAGAVVTADRELAERVRALRQHGERLRNVSSAVGYTARLDTLQAAVLRRKLPLLPAWNVDRRGTAAAYTDALAGVGDVCTLPVPPGSEPVWHLYPVRTRRAQALQEFLGDRGIATGRHYPLPPHLSAAYEHLGHGPGAFPVAERLAAETLSLPIFPGISEGQRTMVIDAVKEFFACGV